jgi:hypothetical protein
MENIDTFTKRILNRVCNYPLNTKNIDQMTEKEYENWVTANKKRLGINVEYS